MDEKENKVPETKDTEAALDEAVKALEEEAEKETAAEKSATASAPTETAPVEAASAPKKSKKGLAIGLTVGVLALAGGGIGVAYAMTNTPENIALSAVSNFLSSNARNINGTIELAMKKTSSSIVTNCSSSINCISTAPSFMIESAKIELSSNADNNGQSFTTAKLIIGYNGETYEVSLGVVVIKDYTIYVSVDGVKDAAKKLLPVLTNGNTAYADIYEELVSQVAGEVDGKWWKISVPDLVDTVEELSSSEKTKVKEVYGCVTNVLDKIQSKGNDYAEIYKKNAFVNIEKYNGNKTFSGKGTAYNISLDADKYVSFANEMTDELDKLELNKCLEELEDVPGVTTSYEVTKVKKSDVETVIENLPDIVVTIDNGFFSHELTGIYVEKDDTGYSGKIDLTFSKSTGEVKVPDDAKSAITLYEDVMDKVTEGQETAECKYIKQNYPTYYKYYCDEDYHAKTNFEVQPNVNI